jgi:hypothetical protein
MVNQNELIEYAKSYLKPKGFKKKNKRWTKDIGEFTLVFYIQGSVYSKENYYVRPGIFINKLLLSIPLNPVYGHFWNSLRSEKIDDVLIDFEKFCEDWTDKKLIRDRALAFIEWDKRNPLEKRRAGTVDYIKDPVPAEEFFTMDDYVIEYIVKSF